MRWCISKEITEKNVRSSIWALVPVTACLLRLKRFLTPRRSPFFSPPSNLVHRCIEAIEEKEKKMCQTATVACFCLLSFVIVITIIVLYFSNRSLSSATHTRARSIMCEKIFDCIRCNVCHQTAEVRTNGSLQWIYFLRKENFVLYCMQMRDGWMDGWRLLKNKSFSFDDYHAVIFCRTRWCPFGDTLLWCREERENRLLMWEREKKKPRSIHWSSVKYYLLWSLW